MNLQNMKRTNGAVLKAMGLKTGVPDVVLPVASHNFHGLYLEMKYGNNKPTKAQEEYMAALRQQGYKTVVCYGAEEAKTEIMEYLQDPERMPLAKCINAPWIDGMCAKEPCRGCEKHRKTRAESVIEANMATVDDCFKRPVIKAIADLAAGKPLQNITLEETLETINKNLALLAKGDWLTVEQSAEVLTVVMDAYKQAKKGKGE